MPNQFDDRRERPNKKNIESLNLTQKNKSFKALTRKKRFHSMSAKIDLI